MSVGWGEGIGISSVYVLDVITSGLGGIGNAGKTEIPPLEHYTSDVK